MDPSYPAGSVLYHQRCGVMVCESACVIRVNVSGSSVDVEDTSEAGSGKEPFESGGDEETETSRHFDSPLKLLQTQPRCEVYPDLHKIIQVSWSGKMAHGGIRSRENNERRVFICRRNSRMSSRSTSSPCRRILFTTSTVLHPPRKTWVLVHSQRKRDMEGESVGHLLVFVLSGGFRRW